MVGAAQRGGGNAGHRAAERQMAMAEEDMPDLVAVPSDDLAERRIVQQPDLVHRAKMGRHRIVMHEQQKRTVMFGQPLLEPVLSRRAIASGMGPGFCRVEKQAAARDGVVDALREAICLGVFGKHAEKGRAIIVVADAEPDREAESCPDGSVAIRSPSGRPNRRDRP